MATSKAQHKVQPRKVQPKILHELDCPVFPEEWEVPEHGEESGSVRQSERKGSSVSLRRRSTARASEIIESLWTPAHRVKVRDTVDDWFEVHCRRWVALLLLFLGVPLTGVGGVVLQGWFGTFGERVARDCRDAWSIEVLMFRPENTPTSAMIVFPIYWGFLSFFRYLMLALPFLVTSCESQPVPLRSKALVVIVIPLVGALVDLIAGFLEQLPHDVCTVIQFFAYKWGLIAGALWLSRRQLRVVSTVHLLLALLCWVIYPVVLTFSGIMPILLTNAVMLGVLLAFVGVSIRCRTWQLGPRGHVCDLGTGLLMSLLMDAFPAGATRLFVTIIQGLSAKLTVIVLFGWFVFVSAVKFSFHGLAGAALPEAWLLRAFFPVQFIGVWVGVLLFSKIDPMSPEFLGAAAVVAVMRVARDTVELREWLLKCLGREDDDQTVRDRIITNVFVAFQQTTTEFASELAIIVFLLVEMLQTRTFGIAHIILQQGHGLTSASYAILATLQLASLTCSMHLNARLLKRHGLEDLLSQGLSTATLLWYSSCELVVLHGCLWVLQVNRLFTLRLEECREAFS